MADAHYNLANIYLEREEFSMALVHYRAAVELRPNWEKARRGVEQTQEALAAIGNHPVAWRRSRTSWHLQSDW